MSELAPLPQKDVIRHSETIAKLAAALAKAQGEFGELQKNREADTGSYKYKYADLAAVLESVRPALSKNELAFMQLPVLDQGNLRIHTRLIHSSGEWIESEYPVSAFGQGEQRRNHQQIGSSLTYARRYACCAMLGIAAEEDLDAPDDIPVQEPAQRKAPPKKAPEREPPAVVQNKPDDGKKPLPPRVDEKGAGEKAPAEERKYVYIYRDGTESENGFKQDDFTRTLEADIIDCGKEGDKDGLDELLANNAESMKALSEQSKSTIETAIEKANKALRAAAVEKDPEGGEPGPMI